MSAQLEDDVGSAPKPEADQVDAQTISLPAELQQQFQSTLDSLQADRFRQITARDALDRGIATVYQDLALSDNLDVESVLVGGEELVAA